MTLPAEPPADTRPASTPRACPCAEDARGEYRHDGLLLRSAPGVAAFWSIVSGETGPSARTSVRGIGQSSAIELGGTPAPGLVLGAAVWVARVDPVFVEGGKHVSSDDDSVKLTQLRVGPFVDFYPNPRRGFHGTVAPSLVVEFETDTKGDPVEPLWYGAALATGAGYEWFLAREVSIGLLGRFAFGSVARTSGGTTERLTFVAPELALTATYH